MDPLTMGFFPGKQTATPSKRSRSPSRGGGGGSGRGSTAPTPLKTSPALSDEVNAERMAANKAAGVGDAYGRSPSDPNYGTAPKAPSEQFKTTGGAAEVNKPTDVDRQRFTQELAYKQEVSSAGRAYASSVYEAVRTSPARRKDVDEQPERDMFREKGGSAKSSYSYKREGGKLRLFVTPEPQDKKKLDINIPPFVERGAQAAYTGLKTTGYIVGQPFVQGGRLIEYVGEKLEARAQKNNVPSLIQRPYRVVTTTTAKGIKYTGQAIKGGGLAWTETPGRTFAFTGAFAAISFALQPVSLAVGAVASKLPKMIPTSIKTQTPKVIGTAAVGAYAYFTGKRVAADPKPAERLGRIIGGELIPAAGGSIVGEYAFLKVQGAVRTIGSKFVPIEKLTPKEVLTGQKSFPSAPQKQHMKLFKEGKYAIRQTTTKTGFETAKPGKFQIGGKPTVNVADVNGRFTITKSGDKLYYPHATPAQFGKKFTAQEGARPAEAAGMFVSGGGVSIYFLRIAPAKVSYYPRTILPEAVTPTIIYTSSLGVKPLPKAVKAAYGKVPYGKSYQFFTNQAKKGVIYVPGVKGEVEGIQAAGSLFKQVGAGMYTKVGGVKVPMRFFDPRTKISARQYYYPAEDLAARATRYYYPKSIYNVPGSTYLILSGIKSSVGTPTTTRLSSYSAGSKPYYPPGSPTSYKPSSYVSPTSYSITPPVSRISPSYSGGSSGRGSGGSRIPSPLGSSGGGSSITRLPPSITPPPPPPIIDLEFPFKQTKKKQRKKLLRPYKYQASLAGVVRKLKGKSGLAGIKARGIPLN